MAELYAQLGNYESAAENLRLAAEQAILCDEEYFLAPDQECTSLPFKGMKINTGLKMGTHFSTHQLEKMANNPAFGPIRQNRDFIEIDEMLKKYAEKL